MREHGWLARLPATIGPRPSALSVGVGDDAAVLDVRGAHLVWTVDTQVEHVHFTREFASFEDVGFRAVMAAASDVAAMGGRVLSLLSSLIVPPDLGETELDAIVAGQRAATEELGAPIVGGNVARGTELSVTISVLGEAARPVTRGGAKAGDGVWLLGPVGLAAAGLLSLQRGTFANTVALAACVAAWRRPVARISGSLAAAERASAGIDVSDGLAQDAAHVARASGVTLELDADACARAGGDALRDAASELSVDARDLALAGGEDYALVFTSRPSLTDAGFVRIGEVCTGPGEVVVVRDGRRGPPPPGWDHGAGPAQSGEPRSR